VLARHCRLSGEGAAIFAEIKDCCHECCAGLGFGDPRVCAISLEFRAWCVLVVIGISGRSHLFIDVVIFVKQGVSTGAGGAPAVFVNGDD
jgi:hypothetical protein